MSKLFEGANRQRRIGEEFMPAIFDNVVQRAKAIGDEVMKTVSSPALAVSLEAEKREKDLRQAIEDVNMAVDLGDEDMVIENRKKLARIQLEIVVADLQTPDSLTVYGNLLHLSENMSQIPEPDRNWKGIGLDDDQSSALDQYPIIAYFVEGNRDLE